VLPHVSHNSSFRTDALKLGLTELINHASGSVKHYEDSDREEMNTLCGDTVTFEKR
jgi:hypothetical protein